MDLGSFVLEAGGVRWASDLGPDDYDLPGYLGRQRPSCYRIRTEANNTLLIDGENQDLRAEARITRQETSPDLSWVQIDLCRTNGGKLKQWLRRVGLAQRQTILVSDSLTIDQPVEVIWGMMTDAEIQPNGQSATLHKNNWSLAVEIRTPRHAVFDVAPVHPASPQAPNTGFHKLIVRLGDKVTDLTWGADESLTDPNDPNYPNSPADPPAVYLIRRLQRVYVPDPATLNLLDGGDSTTVYSQPTSQIGFLADYVVTIPVAATGYPSIQDGTIYWEYNGGATPETIHLAISCYRGSDTIPTHYRVQQAGQTYVNTVTSPGLVSNPPTLLKLPCAHGDIDDISGDTLPATCLIMPAGGTEVDVFLDGIRRHVPDPATLAILDPHIVGQVINMPPVGFSAIPQGPALTPLTNSMLVMSSTPAVSLPQYWIVNSQLCHVPDPQALTNWGINENDGVQIDAQQLSLLTMGKQLPENPPRS